MVAPVPCPPFTPTNARVLWDGPELTAHNLTTVPANLVAMRPRVTQKATTTNARVKKVSTEPTAISMSTSAGLPTPAFMVDAKTPMVDTNATVARAGLARTATPDTTPATPHLASTEEFALKLENSPMTAHVQVASLEPTAK